MSSSTSDKERLVVSDKCACGSENCWITQLSHLDREVLPDIRVARCGRCEPCLMKYNIILHGTSTPENSSDVKRETTKTKEVSMGSEDIKVETPISSSNSIDSQIVALCDYVPTSTTQNTEKGNRSSTDRLWAKEVSKTGSATSDIANSPLFGFDQLNSLGVDRVDTVDGLSNHPTEYIEKDKSKTVEPAAVKLPVTRAAESAVRSEGIEVKLRPFTVTTVDLDSGTVTVAETTKVEMRTAAQDISGCNTLQGSMDGVPDNTPHSSQLEEHATPRRKMTVRTKIYGPRNTLKNNLCCPSNNTLGTSKNTARSTGYSYNIKVSTRNSPLRCRLPDSPRAKVDTGLSRGSSYSGSKSITSKTKQRSRESMSSGSVDGSSSKSGFQPPRRSRLSNQQLYRSSNSKGSNASEERPPWYPMRSTNRWDHYEVQETPVVTGGGQRTKGSKTKSKSSPKVRTVNVPPLIIEPVYDISGLANQTRKSGKKKGRQSGQRLDGKTSEQLGGLELGNPVYCSFRGIVLPRSIQRDPATTRRVVTLGSGKANTYACCTDERCEEQHFQYDSDDTCYVSEDCDYCGCVDVSPCSCGSGTLGGAECGHELQNDHLNFPQHTVQCIDPRSMCYECTCSPNCKSVVECEVDTYGNSHSITTHVCEYCSTQPDGTVCPTSTFYSSLTPPRTGYRRATPATTDARPYVVYRSGRQGAIYNGY
ncbi:uncharacterized protein BXIN_1333 [Babesia sp. Xinjiang]|uniref:uncharacterized protein n=1 Tax=Babesia sp. Xinjiang TaxID=462227 RepID=UPI000A222F4C|nr:uncharacterized protein BXIN_1333 [Babesia sp. Xinjiang]ORM40126.1 hypothetical protein BXIN_1333 [Babesia sp. Xinjiang]